MLGNVYAKYENDFKTATKFYDKAIEVNSDDFIAINNIGANLLHLQKFDEALRYFELAYSINQNYTNTLIGFAFAYLFKGDMIRSFNYGIETIKKSNNKDAVYNNAVKLLNDVSVAYDKTVKEHNIYKRYQNKIEEKCKKEIEFQTDNNLIGTAKIEIAEYYNRDKHILKYKADTVGLDHIIMHEFSHLDLVIQARENNNNYVFYSTDEHRKRFLTDIESYLLKLEKKGINDKTIKEIAIDIFNGMNNQIYNTPIDLIIEEKLFYDYPELRPIQYLSLKNMYTEYTKGINLKNRSDIAPYMIVEANAILILTQLLQFKELFGIDLITQNSFDNKQKRIANNLYNHYKNVKDSLKPGDEYGQIDYWIKEMNIPKYYDLIFENDFKGIKPKIDEILNHIENDPFNFNDAEAKAREGKRLNFKDSPAGSMAVTMYILDALQTFDKLTENEIREIGFEIGMLGRYGIDPGNNEKKFHLKSIPDKTFSGLHLLSFMYTAFLRIEPTLDSGLDFENEYQLALQLFKK